MMEHFKVIAEKNMGRMKLRHRRRLIKITDRREALVTELESLDVAQNDIFTAAMEHLQIDTDGAFRGLRLQDDGDVVALYCTCAPCQAELNNVSVTAATKVMIDRGLIHPEEAMVSLQRAVELDKQRGRLYIH